MSESTNTKWINGMSFESEINGHKIIVDAAKEFGGENRGPRPKMFMLSALGGCTAMDVISILGKMKVTDDIEDFTVNVSGDLTSEHPKHFVSMHVRYEFTPKAGKELPLDKIQKAVSLSEERYCGVSASYRKAMKLTSEIVIK
jgi:putative redox protein